MRQELATIRRSVNFEWDRITVAATAREENRHFEGSPPPRWPRRAASTCSMRCSTWRLTEDLATVFRIDRQQGPAHVEFRKRMAQHPLLMAGASDAGAHSRRSAGPTTPRVCSKISCPTR